MQPEADAPADAPTRPCAVTGSPTTEGIDQERPTDPLLGEVLGDVEIVRLISEGGMGRVYEGRQRIATTTETLGSCETRRVAVKVLRATVTSDDMRLRFAAEARLLARLDHPGIARIYGAGTRDVRGEPVPFIVMEFVPEAMSLVAHAVGQRLSTRQRLALFRDLCEAVAHGHLKGIIHRDLKPGNVLVAGSGPLAGRPRVIDFGIARATDPDTTRVTRQTAAGHVLGTLPYMSPEQFSGDPDAIDIRVDVYALGVVLYELLTGRHPHDVRRKTALEAARIIRDEDPTPLTALDKSLRGDVAAIAHKCLAKDPRRRYSSAAELADDVGRHLDGRPISVSPPGLVDGLVRLARRHRAAAAAAVASLAALLIALVGIAIFAARADRSRSLAERATQRAERDRAAAEDLVQFLTFNLRDRLAEADRLDLLGGVLDHLEGYHAATRRLAEDGFGQPSVRQRRQRGVMLNSLGDLERSLGRPEAAGRAYREAFVIATGLAEETPGSIEFQRDLAVSHRKLAAVARDGGDGPLAWQHLTMAREICQQLVTLCPGDPSREWDLAGSLDERGQLALAAGDVGAARREFTDLEHVMRRLTVIDPTNLPWRRDLAIALQKLGMLEDRVGDAAAAQDRFGEALVILSDLVAVEPGNRRHRQDLCTTIEKLATACAASGDAAAARRHAEKALALAAALAAEDPRNADCRYGLAVCHERLGMFGRADGDPSSSDHFHEFRQIVEQLAEAQPRNPRWQREVATAYGHLAAVAADAGDTALARDWYRRGLEIAERLYADARDPQSVTFRLNILEPLLECHRRLGEEAEAERCGARIESLRDVPAPVSSDPAA